MAISGNQWQSAYLSAHGRVAVSKRSLAQQRDGPRASLEEALVVSRAVTRFPTGIHTCGEGGKAPW